MLLKMVKEISTQKTLISVVDNVWNLITTNKQIIHPYSKLKQYQKQLYSHRC
jgi:hypothetical protein